MTSSDQKILHITLEVSGRVQGVGFRYAAQNEANRLRIMGYIKNRPNGNVMLEIEGSVAQLNAMIRWCRTGPPLSRVEQVKEWSGEVIGYNIFQIR
ncbi:MAG: acylphosphatase [Bacteroidales bacterium]